MLNIKQPLYLSFNNNYEVSNFIGYLSIFIFVVVVYAFLCVYDQYYYYFF